LDGKRLLVVDDEPDVLDSLVDLLIGVMLTAYAMTPEDIKRSYENGAASFVPKEKMADITTYLTDIYEAKEKGKNLWWRWFDRLADYCEKKFGPDWQKDHGFKVR
jgi:hypothetical protein